MYICVCSVADRSGLLAHMMGATLASRQKGYDHVYLTTESRLTSLDPKGKVNWQASLLAQLELTVTLKTWFRHGLEK